MAELPEGVERWVMRVVDCRKEHTGEEWSELRETPHPEGEWIKVEDLPAIEAAVVERIRESLASILAICQEVAHEVEDPTQACAEIEATAREALATLDQERADG